MTQEMPPIQLFVNLILLRPGGDVLLARYDVEDERWMIPYADLEPYEHPDETARRGVEALQGLAAGKMRMTDILSFRGRQGWHIVFNYRAEADGTPRVEYETRWFPVSALPRTMHGRWEHEIIGRLAADRRKG